MRSEPDQENDFGAFVRRHTAEETTTTVDWQQERIVWLDYLDGLYGKILDFLRNYTDAGEIKVHYENLVLNEENIGSYVARQMMIRIGNLEIALIPVGTLLVGAKGRVDIVGPAGTARLVLVNSEASAPTVKVTVKIGRDLTPTPSEAMPREIKWTWKIATNPPAIRYIELTQESFFQALMEVANG